MEKEDKKAYQKAERDIAREKIGKRDSKPKGKLLSIIILVVIIGLFSFLFINKDYLMSFIGDNEPTNDTQIVADKNFVKGLRLSSVGRYDEAVGYFNKLNYKNMVEDDQEVVLMAYIKSGDEQKALDLEQKADKEVVNHLLKEDDMSKLRTLNTKSELIDFEIAIIGNDFERLIELKNKPEIAMDERRANAVANAYYQMGDKEQAVKFTSLMAFDGINIWKSEGKVNKTDEYNQLYSKNSTSFNMMGSIFIVILISIFISGIVFLIYKIKRNGLPFLNKRRQTEYDEDEYEETEQEVEQEIESGELLNSNNNGTHKGTQKDTHKDIHEDTQKSTHKGTHKDTHKNISKGTRKNIPIRKLINKPTSKPKKAIRKKNEVDNEQDEKYSYHFDDNDI